MALDHQEIAEALGGEYLGSLPGASTELAGAALKALHEGLSAEQIRQIRGDRTFSDAARIAGVTPAAWRNWEEGHRTPRQRSILKILRVARADEEERSLAERVLDLEDKLARLERVVAQLVDTG